MTDMDLAQPGAAVRRRAGFRRLLVSLGIAGGGLSAMYAGVGTVLLPLQIERIDRAHKIAVLGLVAGVSAVFALVFNPVGGALSDRTRSRFGRRAPWLVAASAVLLVMLTVLGQAGAVLARPPRDTRPARARLGTFVSALRHRDFALVFVSRAAAILG
jgi:MFS family permease